MYSVYVIVCVCVCVCVCLCQCCVASQSPLFHKLYLYLLWIPNFPRVWKKLRELYNFKNITIHSLQNSQHTVCPQAPTLLPHIYNKKIHLCKVHMLSLVCMHASVPMFVLLHSPCCFIRCIFMFFKI